MDQLKQALASARTAQLELAAAATAHLQAGRTDEARRTLGIESEQAKVTAMLAAAVKRLDDSPRAARG